MADTDYSVWTENEVISRSKRRERTSIGIGPEKAI